MTGKSNSFFYFSTGIFLVCLLAGFISSCQGAPVTGSPLLLPSLTANPPSPSPSAQSTALLRPTSSVPFSPTPTVSRTAAPVLTKTPDPTLRGNLEHS